MKRKSRKKVETKLVIKDGKVKKRKEISIDLNVLDTLYTLRIPVDTTELDDESANGLTDDVCKDIQIRDLRSTSPSKKYALEVMKHNIRHEVIHAMIKECGLGENNSSEVAWPVEESFVDWVASKHEKMDEIFNNAYEILKLLDD